MVEEIDAIERCAKRLTEAIDALSMEQLNALAERLGSGQTRMHPIERRYVVKRALLGVTEARRNVVARAKRAARGW